MITVTNLSKRFDTQFVVDNISLKINEGEIVGLLGPNGAGKTTTLRMITGVLPPTKGAVVIDGRDITQESDSLKKRIGFLPENNPLYEDVTVEEYLRFWADIKRINKEKRKEAIDFVVDSCGIAEVYYRPISELSKGYRQRVGLSQAILTKPDILVLDEPTEGLDPNQRQDIAKLILSLGKKRTVIISSHVLSEVARFASRLIIINKGTVAADDTPERLRQFKSSTQTVEVEIKGEKILEKLKALENVTKVKEQRKNYYILEVNKGKDIREKLFKTAVTNKWILLTMMQKERALEDVFAQLTSE